MNIDNNKIKHFKNDIRENFICAFYKKLNI